MDKSQNTIRARLTVKDAFSIPNIMSYFRMLLIPVFMVTYLKFHLNYLTFGIIVLSALTDIFDGFIARKFHMITDWGKLIDPVADKLTQFCVMICLVFRFHIMIYLAVIIVVKEITTFTIGYLTFHKTGKVRSADWHGKVCTALLYGTFMLHFLWEDIPRTVTNGLVLACGVMMLLSFVLYISRYDTMIKKADKEENE